MAGRRVEQVLRECGPRARMPFKSDLNRALAVQNRASCHVELALGPSQAKKPRVAPAGRKEASSPSPSWRACVMWVAVFRE